MKKLRYPFVIYPAEEGGYVGEVPSLKGCLAQGETLDETLTELSTVTELWIETARRRGQKLPSPKREINKVKELLAA